MNLDARNLAVKQMLKRVVRDVKNASEGKQDPWMEGSIEGDLYFKLEQDPSVLELEYWDRAKNSQDASEYEAYLKQYPIEAFAD